MRKIGLTGSTSQSKRPAPPPPAATKRKAPPVASLPAAKMAKLPPPSSPRKHLSKVPVASLGARPAEEVELAACLQATMEEDRLARTQIFGTLDKTSTSKLADLEQDGKMPAQASDTQRDDVSLLDGAEYWSTEGEDSEDSGDFFDQEYRADRAKQDEEIRAWTAGEGPLVRTLASDRQLQQEQVALAALLYDDWNNDNVINAKPNTEMRDDFKAFCADARDNHMKDLTKVQVRSVKLLHTLKQKKSPLNAFDAIMDWYHRERQSMAAHQGLDSVAGYISRDVMMDTIKERYNMTSKFPTNVPLMLPVLHAKVSVTVHDTWNCIQTLLTNPRRMGILQLCGQ